MIPLLTVQRYHFKPDWTIGRLEVNGQPNGFVIEDEIREVKIRGETAIPFGDYSLGLRESPKFSKSFYWSDTAQILVSKESSRKGDFKLIKDWRPHDLIWIKNVPGFEYILIHWGNFDDDTDGCLIVGDSIGFAKNRKGIVKEAVLNSKVYYQRLYSQIYNSIREGGKTISIRKAK